MPTVLRIIPLLICLGAAPAGLAAQAPAATSARGAPDPCTVLTVEDAAAVAGVAMAAIAIQPPNELVRTCTYHGKSRSGGGNILLSVTTYRCLTEPAALVHRLEQNPWGNARFRRERDLGALTTSIARGSMAQFTGYQGSTGLTVQVAGSAESYALARRGFSVAFDKLR